MKTLLEEIEQWYNTEIRPRKRISQYAYSVCPVCHASWGRQINKEEMHNRDCWIPRLQAELAKGAAQRATLGNEAE